MGGSHESKPPTQTSNEALADKRTMETYTNSKGIKGKPSYSNGTGLRINKRNLFMWFVVHRICVCVCWYINSSDVLPKAMRQEIGPNAHLKAPLKPMTWEYMGGKHQLLAPQDNTNPFSTSQCCRSFCRSSSVISWIQIPTSKKMLKKLEKHTQLAKPLGQT